MTVYEINKKFPYDYVYSRIIRSENGTRSYEVEWVFHSYADYLVGSESLNLSKEGMILIPPFSSDEYNDDIPARAAAEYWRAYYAS